MSSSEPKKEPEPVTYKKEPITTPPPPPEPKKEPVTFKDVMNKAAKSAVRGGTAGAAAMGANVRGICLCICLCRIYIYIYMLNLLMCTVMF